MTKWELGDDIDVSGAVGRPVSRILTAQSTRLAGGCGSRVGSEAVKARKDTVHPPGDCEQKRLSFVVWVYG